jgi:elongation factor Ts
MAITAGKVKELREKTGLPMMECKKALEEVDGAIDKAIELLRKKGLAQASKRAGRATGEGRLTLHSDPPSKRVAIVELLCETEPVSTTKDFISLGQAAAQVAVKLDSPTPEAIAEHPHPADGSRKIGDALNDVINRIRENIKFGRVHTATGHVAQYLHHDGRKGVLVEFSGECPDEIGNDVCMHIAAMRPMCTRREEVDPQLVEAERKLAAEQVKGKPENIIDKIVSGKIDKWFSDIVLLEQPFVKDDKKSVGQVLREVSPDLTVTRFVRIEIGEA